MSERLVIVTEHHISRFEMLRNAVEGARKIEDIVRRRGSRRASAVDTATQQVLYETVIDFDTVRAIRGAGFGAYMELLKDGFAAEANMVMAEEGVPQIWRSKP